MQTNAVNVAVGRKVASFRKVFGWSQSQLAERFGEALGRPLDATQITRLEQGKRPVAVHELVALCKVLRVQPMVFFDLLSPLDTAIEAQQMAVQAAESRVKAAAAERALADLRMRALKALASYRDTRDLSDLPPSMALLYMADIHGADWRELLLDAGVPAAAIDVALAAAPGFPGTEDDEELRDRFVTALRADIADPPKRRRKTGKAAN